MFSSLFSRAGHGCGHLVVGPPVGCPIKLDLHEGGGLAAALEIQAAVILEAEHQPVLGFVQQRHELTEAGFQPGLLFG